MKFKSLKDKKFNYSKTRRIKNSITEYDDYVLKLWFFELTWSNMHCYCGWC